jgi:glycosyltransferase involved in cell wall biosynthesis
MRCSYIIAHAGSEPSRLRNLHFLLRSVRAYPFEIIVVEQGRAPALTLEMNGIRHVFCYNPGRFNRAWAFNVGARLAQGDVLVCSDHDIVVPREALLAIPRVERLIIPYQRCLDLSREETRVLHATGSVPEGAGTVRSHTTAGGAFIIARRSFLDIGGMCEDFEGWGAEDEAFDDKCRKTIGVLRSTSVAIVHMHHEREAWTPAADDDYRRNVRLLRRERAKLAADWLESASVDIGDPHKYIRRAVLHSRRALASRRGGHVDAGGADAP